MMAVLLLDKRAIVVSVRLFLPHLKRVLFQERGTDAVTDTNIQQVFHGLSRGHIWKQGKQQMPAYPIYGQYFKYLIY